MAQLAAPPAEEPRDFAAFLLELSNGRTEPELSETLRTLLRRVQDTGKKGSMSLTLVVEPLKGTDKQVLISDTIKTKLPEHDRASSYFFLDKAGRPSRNDPRQESLFSSVEVRDTPPPPRRFEVVDTATGEITTRED